MERDDSLAAERLRQFFQSSETGMGDRVPPGQHLTNKFPVLTFGDTPSINVTDWQLKVWGLTKEVLFSWLDLMAMSQSTFTDDFHCVTGWSKLDVQWTGIKVLDFMRQVKVEPQAAHILAHCYGGYTTNIAIDDFLREENFFAHTLFGEPLPSEHGGPLRLVVPHLYAWKSAKWINGLEFLEQEDLGFWERNGYHRRGNPWAIERCSD
ncbi:sulfite oxidase-like oxidoreductase [Phormidium sp. CLA17]|uniref:sulfite oxidase-like oxidoreductase n=1 Tax=Leptolyngbya sp. Cla-17 TaxID=2803751 RepID=UPI0014914838|nr:sulfite oxidase-like oxidoreductase [Leptolyngbya sp. Cla-17]MBM0740093.1 sulfite oxidase-like oxidoreductase [Leptolyngbya sp. Cla-17]